MREGEVEYRLKGMNDGGKVCKSAQGWKNNLFAYST